MGVFQACLSDVLPPVGTFPVTARRERPARKVSATSRQSNSHRAVAPRAMGEEWAAVQQAIAGNAHAQQLLFARYTGMLYRTAFTLLRNKEDAEDAVQDGLCNAYANLRFFQGRSSFATWLTRIVINSALMSLRKRRVHPETSLDEILESQSESLPRAVIKEQPSPEKIVAANEIRALVEQHVRQLPAALRAAFRLAVVEGLSAMESGEVLGVSVSAFKSRIFWARRKIICGVQKSLGMRGRVGIRKHGPRTRNAS
jgi:RNA polymerase sigma-70 factor (ECF subfamily)